MTKIVLYASEQEAINALAHFESVERQLLAVEGYTVVDEGIISKNMSTGEDMPEAIVDKWDTIQSHPDGGYYFTSPKINEAYTPYFDQLVTGDYTELEYIPPVSTELV
jgi:hypothetical protein